MKRQMRIFLMTLVCVVLLCGCTGGNTKHVQLTIGESEIYSEAQIRRAMSTVVRTFQKGYKGCTLLELVYDEEDTIRQAMDWAEHYEVKRAIVLTSAFAVDETGGEGNLEPNSTYQNYQWVLTPGWFGVWKLQNQGYA